MNAEMSMPIERVRLMNTPSHTNAAMPAAGISAHHTR